MQVVSPSLVPVLLAVTVASVAAGCGEDRVGAGTRTGGDDGVRIACTEVGCIGGATLDLRGVPPTARSVGACVEGRCEIVDRRRATMIRIRCPKRTCRARLCADLPRGRQPERPPVHADLLARRDDPAPDAGTLTGREAAEPARDMPGSLPVAKNVRTGSSVSPGRSKSSGTVI